MKSFFEFIKRPLILYPIMILAVIAGVYYLFIKSSSAPADTIIAGKGTIVQEVSVTGKTKPTESIDLAFEVGGRVRAVNADIGDKIYAGQSLVELDSSELYAQLIEAEANIDTQKAEFEKLKKGSKPEEIAVYEIKLTNAKISLEDAKKDLIDKIQDAYTKSDDAIRNKVDQFFRSPRTGFAVLAFDITDSSLQTKVENDRVTMEFLLTLWLLSLNNISTDSDFDSQLSLVENNLNSVKSFLGNVALVLNALESNTTLTQATIDTYRSAVSTARTNVNTGLTNLQTAEEGWRTARSSVDLAEKELVLEKTGATAEQILSQEALVKKAEANAQLYRAKIAKTILRSPINGVLAKQDAKIGEIISANTTIVSVISIGEFELEANIPEADIAKVKIGDSAKITLDAFGGDSVFNAKVSKIDPAEIIIEGVATYKTTFSLSDKYEGIKSGMTANIDIETGRKENILVIPQRAVISKDGEKLARILNSDGTISEISVKTGLRGIDGNVEIIEGLKEGDRVVVSPQ